MKISATKVGTYQKCPKKYQLTYLEGNWEPPSQPATQGRIAHEAIAKGYEHKLATGKEMDIEEKFDVSAAAPVAVAGVTAPAAGDVVAEAKSDFDIELTSVGEKKINVIKVIREITSLGLKSTTSLLKGIETTYHWYVKQKY